MILLLYFPSVRAFLEHRQEVATLEEPGPVSRGGERLVRIRPKAKQGGWMIHSGHATYKRRRFRWHIQCSRGGTLIDQIERRVVARGIGIPMISPSWRKRLLRLAMAFRAPRVLERRRQPVIRDLP